MADLKGSRSHLFVADDGNLYDTRIPGWNKLPPLRKGFQGHHTQTIETTTHLKAILRAGPYAWPGGYPLYFLMADGEALSFQAARDNLSELIQAIKAKQRNDGWRPVAIEVNWESDLFCAHTNEPIQSAYGD